MKEIHAIYENGVFRPIGPVELAERTEVVLDFRTLAPEFQSIETQDERALNVVYQSLSRSFPTGDPFLAERHNDHQP